jgi:arylsulfatase A-like enzyme
LIQTPHVDQLAKDGTRFTKAFVIAPECSPCRSALITGCYQTTIGAHHHYSERGELKLKLPEGVVPVPALFQKAGSYTCIGGFQTSAADVVQLADPANGFFARLPEDGHEESRFAGLLACRSPA